MSDEEGDKNTERAPTTQSAANDTESSEEPVMSVTGDRTDSQNE